MIKFFITILLTVALLGWTKKTSIPDAAQRYGQISPVKPGSMKLVWPDQSKWIMELDLSFYNIKGLKSLNINLDTVPPLLAVLTELSRRGLLHEIRQNSGAISVRYVRGYEGTRRISCHAYGLAIDLNVFQNPLGSFKHSWSKEFIRVWESYGWTWGGRWGRRPDPMHFSWCWEPGNPYNK